MVKRMYHLSKVAYEWLAEESAKLDISASEFLRRIVDEKRKRSVKK